MTNKEKETKKLVDETMDFIGMCLQVPLSKTASTNIRKWLTVEFYMAWSGGKQEGFDRAIGIMKTEDDK